MLQWGKMVGISFGEIWYGMGKGAICKYFLIIRLILWKTRESNTFLGRKSGQSNLVLHLKTLLDDRENIDVLFAYGIHRF